MSNSFNGHELDGFDGMISAEEAELLHSFSSTLKAGCIVEIGSWRGKSAVALARGAALQAPERRPMIYCVDPHEHFTGVYGGQFGPRDRTAFYETMLRAGCAESVALVNLASAAASQAWPHKVGFLFIDGDHTEAAVEADVAAWERHIVEGGYIAFDDALDPDIGPARVIANLLASLRYKQAAVVGKIVVLQKTPETEHQRRWASHAEALVDVHTRALAAGYNGDFASARLSYASFVSPARRYMYMETPKAACTSWKRLVVAIERAEVRNKRLPYQRETRKDMLIHQRRHIEIPSMLDVSPQERRAIFGGASDWLVFALCRNPYSRLVSVFENKVRFREPGYSHLYARYGDGDARAGFCAFVREVAADPEQRVGDAHLRAQSELLLTNLIPHRVYPIEDMQAALNAFWTHLEAQGHMERFELERANESVARPWRSYYDHETAAIVAEAYSGDFAAFGYDAGGWRCGQSDFTESEYERRLRAEIVARNEMIDVLHDHLEIVKRGVRS